MAEPGDSDLRANSQRAFELVCQILNPFPIAAHRPLPAGTKSDWAAVYEFAAFHGVRPALQKAMPELSAADPGAAELRERLAVFQRAHRFRVMQTTAQIVRLAQAFQSAGVRALFFKGAMLGEQVYGGAQYREFNDVDILVSPTQRQRGEEVLKSLEFQPIVDDLRMRSAFFDYLRQHDFRHAESQTTVDFHWGFVGTGPFPILAENALASCVSVKLAGVDIPVPGVESLALILAGHGHKENWASFGWILDFATFASLHPALDWGNIMKAARAQSCLDPVLGATLLVERLFGFTIDKAIAELATRRPSIDRTVERIIASIGSLAERELGDELLGGFRLCETPVQRARVALSLLTTRTIGDFEAMPLPARWWWIYRVTRPVRLTMQRLLRRVPRRSDFWKQKKDARR